MEREEIVAIRLLRNGKNQGCRIDLGRGQRFTQTGEKEEGKAR